MSPRAKAASRTKEGARRKTSAKTTAAETTPAESTIAEMPLAKALSSKATSSKATSDKVKSARKTSSAKRPTQRNVHHNVYVIRLDDAVLKVRRFALANPGHVAGKPCVYVGMTGLTPEERFANHKAGVRSCSIVKRFGEHLMPGYYVTLNPMPFDKAAEMEKRLAEELRRNGFAVWQN